MITPQIAFQVQYAAVDAGDGTDPRERSLAILRRERVLAALRDAGASWNDDEEAVLLVPVTDEGAVVALGDDDRLRFDLTAAHLRELFTAEGLTLWLASVDDDLVDAADLDEIDDLSLEMLDEEELTAALLGAELDSVTADEARARDEIAALEQDFAVEPVAVAEFSHRGVLAARATAQLAGAEVAYREDGVWSLLQYRTTESVLTVPADDGVVIALNVPAQGAAWVEIGTSTESVPFWPNIDRDTRPVLDVEAIAVPEIAELYRRMLSEADGSRDELAALGLGRALDITAAHRACMPESVGGVIGADARLRAFVLAFGVPESLVDVALGAADGDASVQRFAPRGWLPLIGDVFIGGLGEATSLTRRNRPLARFTRALNTRPLLGAALSTAELTAGVALVRGRSRLARVAGAFIIIDAVVDLVIWTVRMRRRSRPSAVRAAR